MFYFWFYSFFINFNKHFNLNISNCITPYAPARRRLYFALFFYLPCPAPQPVWSQPLKQYSSCWSGLLQWALPCCPRSLVEVINLPQLKTLQQPPVTFPVKSRLLNIAHTVPGPRHPFWLRLKSLLPLKERNINKPQKSLG